MKLNNNYIDVQGGIGLETTKATISQAKLGKLWDMLQNPYKNNIGSIVRELVSNCFDSHVEAQVQDAVRVRFNKEEAGFTVSFIDVGVGMSPDRVKNIYSNYLESTKELSDSYIGCYGIGSKSPLSYQDVFYINTKFDKIEYNYMMRKGSEGPEIDLLSKKVTTERNGSEIKLIIKNEYDLYLFLMESFRQLYYFSNVVFDFGNLKELYASNYYGQSTYNKIQKLIKLLEDTYKIVEADNFVFKCLDHNYYADYRDFTNLGQLHMVVGNVMYPIDYAALGLSHLDFTHNNIDYKFDKHFGSSPIALKFNIGDLDIIQTREDVRYTDRTKKAIVNKIKQACIELVEKYNNNVANQELDIITAYSKIHNHKFYLDFGLFENIDITWFINNNKKHIKPFTIKDIDIKFKDYQEASDFITTFNSNKIQHCYQHICKFKVVKETNSNGNFKKSNKESVIYLPNVYNALTNNSLTGNPSKRIKTTTSEMSKKKLDYLFHNLMDGDYNYVEFVIPTINQKEIRKQYISIYKYFTKHFRKLTKQEFNSIVKLLTDTFNNAFENSFEHNYDELVVDEVWYKDFKAKNKITVERDNTKMAFETKSHSYLNWSKDSYTLDEFFHICTNKSKYSPKFISLLLKEEEKDKYSSNQREAKTKFDRFIALYNSISTTKVNLYSVKPRNYAKIIANREDDSSIFTLEEFVTNNKIQMRTISKIATYAKIKEVVDVYFKDKLNCSWSYIENYLPLFNEEMQNTYKTVSETLDYFKSFNNSLFTDLLKQLVEDFEELKDHVIIYDKELLSKFYDFMDFIDISNITKINDSINSVYFFVKNYKPVKFKYRLNNNLYIKGLTLDGILALSGYSDSERMIYNFNDYIKIDHGSYYSKNYKVSDIGNHNLIAVILYYRYVLENSDSRAIFNNLKETAIKYNIDFTPEVEETENTENVVEELEEVEC